MPQSLGNVIIHLVFSTRDRARLIDGALRAPLHAYLATACRSCGCEAYRVGGAADHVHVAARLGRTVAVSGLVQTVKTDSSKWAKTQGARYRCFQWQRGYGAFSVSPAHLKTLTDYIDMQEEHHRRETFQEEFRRLLNKCGIAFDERYVWD